MLTLEKIKEYWFPLNISRINNSIAATNAVARYNNSINLYDAIKLVSAAETGTNLTKTSTTTTVDITSSTGSDVTLTSATTLAAGVMSAADKIELESLRTIIGNTGNDLDTFSGSIIPDDSTIKQALQSLENAVGGTLSYLLVDGTTHTLGASKLVYARSNASPLTITLSSSMQELVPYYLLIRPTTGNSITLQTSSTVLWRSGEALETSASSVVYTAEENKALILIRYGAVIFCLNFN